jgi:hypothetical protein
MARNLWLHLFLNLVRNRWLQPSLCFGMSRANPMGGRVQELADRLLID